MHLLLFERHLYLIKTSFDNILGFTSSPEIHLQMASKLGKQINNRAIIEPRSHILVCHGGE